jgi:hypothetical protein
MSATSSSTETKNIPVQAAMFRLIQSRDTAHNERNTVDSQGE